MRRFLQLRESGQDASYEDVLRDQRERDFRDENRAVSPLRRAEDAVLLDTSEIGLEESVALLCDTIREKLQIGG